MPATVTVLYSRKDGAKFDIDYYLATHMPLVYKHWKQYGLQSYDVTEYAPDAPYTYGVAMQWEGMGEFQKAAGGPEAKEIFGDIPNFSSVEPTILAGSVVGTEK